jgi:hypothetical protein
MSDKENNNPWGRIRVMPSENVGPLEGGGFWAESIVLSGVWFIAKTADGALRKMRKHLERLRV